MRRNPPNMMDFVDDPNLAVDVTLNINECLPSTQEEKLLLCPMQNKTSHGRPEVLMPKRLAMRNLLIMSFCYFLYFLGFWALSNLESTMNSSDGLGTESLAVIYAVSMVSSLFLPELVVKTIGCKKALVYGLLISCVYIAANMYVSWETLMPGSVLYGLAAGPLNAAQSIYVEEMAVRYARDSTESLENVMANFFGIFMVFSENTQIWGNIASYFVLNYGSDPVNVTKRACGMDFRHGSESNPNLNPPSDEKRYTLIGIYLLFGVLATISMGLFVDPLYNDVEEMSSKKRLVSVCERVWAAVKLHRDPRQFLLIPLTVLVGLEGAVYSSDFTEAYIACSWGVQHVGFVSVCFGVSGAVMALMVGPLVKYISQMSVIILAAVMNVAVCTTLFLWHPTPDQITIYFIIAGVWGMSDAIWWSQVTALYGLMFPNDREAAFSNFYFWSFLGFFLCYFYANYFTIAVKINILLFMLLTGMAGYLLCLLKIKCTARKEYVVLDHES